MQTSERTGRKRGNAEGSIRQRPKDGLWEARVSLPNGTRKSLYGKTRAEVARKLTEARRTLDQGLTMPTSRLTLAGFATQWLTETIQPSCRPKTYRSYEQQVRNHIVPALGTVKLADLTPLRIQRFLNAKRDAGALSPRSVKMLHEILHNMLGHAHRLGYIGVNPLADKRVPAPRAPRRQVKALSPNDARAVLAAVRGERLEALVTVALAVGLRQGEALGLTWADVESETGTLTVNRQLQRVKGAWQLDEVKSETGRRQIPLPAAVVEALRAHKVRQLEERLGAGARWKGAPWDLVFPTSIGTLLDGVRVTHRFGELLGRAGLEMTFHDLRHGAASLLLAQGVPARVVMEILGHSDIRLTLGTYSHVLPALTREAADRMNTAIWGDASAGLG